MISTRLLKKILLMLSISAALVFIACTQDDTDGDIESITINSDSTLNQEYEGTVVFYSETQRIFPNIPNYDFGGHTFRVLTMEWRSPEWIPWTIRDIVAEELTGNPLNDAVYHRNLALEERYNFIIEQLFAAAEADITILRTAVAAGDNYFDAVSMPLGPLARAAQEGLLVDLLSVHYLDFDQPWWDQGTRRDLVIGNRLFFASGDFMLVNRDAISVILFNKELLADLHFDCPYELVRNGQWTLSNLYEMSRSAAADLGGHGERLNLNTDRFGFLSSAIAGGGIPMMHGMGVRFVGRDENGLPALIFESERNFNVMLAIHDFLRADSTWSFHTNTLFLGGDLFSILEDVFQESRALFKEATVRTIENLRGMDTNFGILPMPWFDEYQREWGHSLGLMFGHGIAIPNFHSVDDLDRVGFMLEAISAESRYTVIPAHSDIQLQGQFIRDDESGEMLDIIFNSVVWDAGIIYNWVSSDVWGAIFSGTVASAWERSIGRIESAMQTTIDSFVGIEN